MLFWQDQCVAFTCRSQVQDHPEIFIFIKSCSRYFSISDFTENTIYEKLLNDKLSTNLGYLYENAVAQILIANGHDLFYYTFKNLEQKRNYEIDFIISKKNKICPIEVKSSNYKKHTSIDEFYKKYSSRILERYIIHTKDVSKDQDILCLPIYLTQFIL